MLKMDSVEKAIQVAQKTRKGHLKQPGYPTEHTSIGNVFKIKSKWLHVRMLKEL